ncbi:hypothetical protein ACFPER_10595 [Agromyces aurantiacus]|uniref:Hypervirulence associated protein TUDOR domain-containing protein n=1 Tax=Agromyces aurantiacus TaxID=165814 RepID=A0ABV9RAQ5_9MICO|nr:hypothetical protein [Agromyces aurantiacus]MBM7503927.1 hypothetical protein [Agromyces aurantiacus]
MSDRTPAGENAEPDREVRDEDRVEGVYTETTEGAHPRGVAGAYTRTDGVADDESEVGDYVSTDEHPLTHDPAERHGKFVRSEPPKPHPGMHHI